MQRTAHILSPDLHGPFVWPAGYWVVCKPAVCQAAGRAFGPGSSAAALLLHGAAAAKDKQAGYTPSIEGHDG